MTKHRSLTLEDLIKARKFLQNLPTTAGSVQVRSAKSAAKLPDLPKFLTVETNPAMPANRAAFLGSNREFLALLNLETGECYTVTPEARRKLAEALYTAWPVLVPSPTWSRGKNND